MNDKQLRKANYGDDGERREDQKASWEERVKHMYEEETRGQETRRGDIKSGPPKLRRNGGSSSSHHPWAEYSVGTSVIKLSDTLRILLVAVLKNYWAKYLKFPLIAQTGFMLLYSLQSPIACFVDFVNDWTLKFVVPSNF